MIVARDFQDGATIQIILDECADMRQLTANMPPGSTHNPEAQGYIAGKIPVTIWHNWRQDWMKNYSDVMTWQTYEIKMLNSRKYRGFKCVDWEIHTPTEVMG